MSDDTLQVFVTSAMQNVLALKRKGIPFLFLLLHHVYFSVPLNISRLIQVLSTLMKNKKRMH